MSCTVCGQQGHKKIDCPLQNVTNTRLCYVLRPSLSSDEGALNRDTVVKVKIGGNWFKALVDSGSSQTLVRSECLGESNTGQGEGSLYPWRCKRTSWNWSCGWDWKPVICLVCWYCGTSSLSSYFRQSCTNIGRLLAEVGVVTRAQVKQEEGTKRLMQSFPFLGKLKI